MQFNPQTYKYEGVDNEGTAVVVDNDVMGETRNSIAQNMFGRDYSDLSDAETDAVDVEALDPNDWGDDNEAGR